MAPPCVEEQPFQEHKVNVCVGEESKDTFVFDKFSPSQSCSHSLEVVRKENTLDGTVHSLTHSVKEELERKKETVLLFESLHQAVFYCVLRLMIR